MTIEYSINEMTTKPGYWSYAITINQVEVASGYTPSWETSMEDMRKYVEQLRNLLL